MYSYGRRRSSGSGSVLDYDPLEEERRRESGSGEAEVVTTPPVAAEADPYAQRIHEVKGQSLSLLSCSRK